MIKTVFKPENEIRELLEKRKNILVFTCGICANLVGTGGNRTLAAFTRMATSWGHDVLDARCVNGCCLSLVMDQALAVYLEPLRDKADALAMLCCAAGVKAAVLCGAGIPVVPLLDTMGASPLTDQPSLVASTFCQGCGDCVLGYTAGICPVSGCALKRKNGPCKKAPEQAGPCCVDPSRACVWREIEAAAGPAGMKLLGGISQKRVRQEPLDLDKTRGIFPESLRKTAGKAMARSGLVSRFVRIVR